MSNIKLENMPNAYKEVNEILKLIPKEDVDKIPDDFKQIIINEMNVAYNFVYDEDKSLEQQKLLFETRTILAYIFVNYWATENQKEIINKKYQMDILEEEKQKKEKYKTEGFLKNNNKYTNTENIKLENNERENLTIKKENLFKRIINKIRKFLKF